MNTRRDKNNCWAIVLAGGDGSRLKRLTHLITADSRPKQFCPFFGGQSLLAHTRDRIAPIFKEEQTMFVLARAHEEYFAPELRNTGATTRLVQPANRGTGVAMILSILEALQRDADAIVAFFPSDHYYANPGAFQDSVDVGLRLVADYPHRILMIGAKPRYPETEYGWIEPGPIMVESVVRPVYRVARFWEKPPLMDACMLQRQACLWNTFVTIGMANAFLELAVSAVPHLVRRLTDGYLEGALDNLYSGVEPCDFSRDVLSKTPARLLVLRDALSGWTDFGSPQRVIDGLTEHGIQAPWLRPGADAWSTLHGKAC